MKVRVLRPALEDLASGREFYNQQQEGVGDYFFDSLFSEIDSLLLLVGAPPEQVIDLIYSHFGHTNWDYPSDSLHALKRLGTPKALDLLSRIVAFWWPELHKGQRAYVHSPEACEKAKGGFPMNR